jgi:phenylpropionate dioxygenase-like ring-hydroxylating dioxygenase large terminal subunit
MNSAYDHIVLGVGGMGSVAACRLAAVRDPDYRAAQAPPGDTLDHVIAHRFQPVSPELTTVVCEWLFPPGTVAGHDLDDTVELFHRVNQQDFAASESCQPNMRSRAYANGGVLVPAEQEIIGRWYYRWYRESMEHADVL